VAFLRNGHQVEEYSYEDLMLENGSKSFLSSEVVLLSCGGKAINAIIDVIKKYHKNVGKRPVIITNFPGIVVESQLEAFITRLRSDFVLLNSRKDEKIYRKVCKVFGIEFNGFMIGALWHTTCLEKNLKKNRAATIFYEQEQVPKEYSDRVVVAQTLLKLAEQNPNRFFYIKNRGNELVDTSIFSILQSLVIKLPDNIGIFNGDVEEALLASDRCITVSSSVALEALLCEQHVILINVGDLKDNHLEFFKSSGLLVAPSDLNSATTKKANHQWLFENVSNPNKYIDTFMSVLHDSTKHMTQPVSEIVVQRLYIRAGLLLSFPFTYLSNFFWIDKKVNSALNVIQGERYV